MDGNNVFRIGESWWLRFWLETRLAMHPGETFLFSLFVYFYHLICEGEPRRETGGRLFTLLSTQFCGSTIDKELGTPSIWDEVLLHSHTSLSGDTF